MFDTAHELCNKFLDIYETQYDKLAKAHKKRIKIESVSENLPIELYLDKDNLNGTTRI